MSEVATIGLDIAKHVFHAHGAGSAGRAVFSRRLTRGKLLDFFAAHPRCLAALEACGGVAAPFGLGCVALWAYAVWAYEHAPHVRNMYDAVNHPLRDHQAESTALYLFGFVGMATICAGVAIYSIRQGSGKLDDRLPRRFGMAILVMSIFVIAALVRLHSVRMLYGF